MRAPLREAEIKARLLTQLRRERVISAKAVIANEYAMRGSVRADLAILDGLFIGVEIKSEFDSLRRLSKQIELYREYFDRVILVLAHRHLAKVRAAWLTGVEVWVAEVDGSLRRCEERTEATNVKFRLLSDLLTRRELRRYASDEIELDHASSRQAFVSAFRTRFGATSSAFWRHVGRRHIRAEDLQLLSRYKAMRVANQAIRERHRLSFQQWHASSTSEVV